MNITDKRIFRIGDIYMMDFEGTRSEQSGRRPALILQNNVGNGYSPNVIALPITKVRKKLSQPTHVPLFAKDTGLRFDSMALCENPECMSKDKIHNYITTLSAEYMTRIAVGYLLATSAISFLDPDLLIEVWSKAVKLNAA